MIFRLTLLITLTGSAKSDFVYKYNSDLEIKPSFQFSLGDDPQKARVQIDTNRPFSMVFKGEKDNSNSPPKTTDLFTYDNEKSGGVYANQSFHDVYNKLFSFYGSVYEDTIKFEGLEFPIEINAITGQQTGARPFLWDGVFGLGIGGNKTGIVERLMKKLSTKQIVIQEGKHFNSRKGKPIDLKSNGKIVFGELSGSSCGEFKYVDALKTGGWRFEADVFFGNELLENQRIGFLPGRVSEVPDFYKQKYFNDVSAKNESYFFDFGFTIANRTYKITKEDYSWYDSATDSHSARIESSYLEYGYDFGFGSELLQHHCIALRADDEMKKFQIGFAENKNGFRSSFRLLLMIIGILFARF